MFVALLLVGGLVACNGSKDKTIKVYTRDTTSGTRDGFFTGVNFKEAIKDNAVLVEGYVEIESNGAMITGVKNDEYGVGYISLASLADSGLKGLDYKGVKPTESNVINSSYKLARNFNYMLRDKHADAKVEKVANALTSAFKGLVKGTITFEHNHTGSGDAWKRTNGGEKDGTNALDLGFASREFKDDESATSKGRIAIDAIVVFVNNKNSLTKITAEQIVKIYKGEVTKWSEVINNLTISNKPLLGACLH